MPIELYLQDELLDLEPGEVIAVTKQINDIADVSKIKADGSNQFKLPQTANNKRILENVGEVSNSTAIPYKLNNARIVQDGVELVGNGKLVVEKSDNSYHVQVVSGNRNFFDLIEGKTLKDLDLTDYNHQWTMFDAVISKDNTSGYIYPIVDMGGLSNSNQNFDVRYQLPALFVRTIWNKIAEEVGFQWKGDFLNSNIFKNLLFLYHSAKTERKSEEYANQQLFRARIGSTLVYDDDGYFPVTFGVEEYDPGNNFSLSTGKFYAPITGKYKFSITYKCTFSHYSYTGIRLSLRKGNTEIFAAASTTFDQLIPLTVESGYIDLNLGDALQLIIQTPPYENTRLSICTLSLLDIKDMVVGYGADWDWKEVMPTMSQKNFIKGISYMYGLVFQPDNFSDVMHVKKFTDITDNLPKAVDWSQKLDLHRTPIIQYRFGSFGQTNHFKYKEDKNPSYITNTGNGSFDIDDKNLPPEITVVELPFAGTPTTTRLQGQKVPRMQVFDVSDDEDVDELVFTHSIEPRILMLNRNHGLPSLSLTYTDDENAMLVGGSVPMCYFDLIDKPDSLSFHHDLLDEHYPTLQQALSRAKKVTAYFRLTQKDISELDHFTPVYIEYFGHSFYVNKVYNYVHGKSTKCELIRL